MHFWIRLAKWLVEKIMNLKPSAIAIRPSGDRHKGVDFVVLLITIMKSNLTANGYRLDSHN